MCSFLKHKMAGSNSKFSRQKYSGFEITKSAKYNAISARGGNKIASEAIV